MKLPSLDERWVLILVTVVLPIILLAASAILLANVCVMMILITWIGVALTMIYLPRVPDQS